MAYSLQAIIGQSVDLTQKSNEPLHTIPLAQGFALWPIGLTVREHFGIGTFSLTHPDQITAPDEIPLGILHLARLSQRCAYVESEMSAGQGRQAYIYFEKGNPIGGVVVGADAVNEALRKLGLVVIGKSRLSDYLRRLGLQSGTFIDEFEAVGLGRFRSTEDWAAEGRKRIGTDR